METARESITQSIGLLILRLGIGGYMLTHGWGKLQLLIAGEVDAVGDPIGIGGGPTLALLVLAEFVCALLVVMGLVTRLAAVPLVIAMGVAVMVAHSNDPWTMDQAVKLFMAGETDFPASKQPAMMFLIPFLALIFTGAGRLSIDGVLCGRRSNVKVSDEDADA